MTHWSKREDSETYATLSEVASVHDYHVPALHAGVPEAVGMLVCDEVEPRRIIDSDAVKMLPADDRNALRNER